MSFKDFNNSRCKIINLAAAKYFFDVILKKNLLTLNVCSIITNSHKQDESSNNQSIELLKISILQ